MPTDPLLERLSALHWPEPALDHPDPEEWQLWRASWDGVASLVVTVSGARDRAVRVLAASPDEGDDSALRVDAQNGMSLTVWTDISADIKTVTLDHRISDLTEWSAKQIELTRPGTGAWSAVTDAEDERALVRAELHDEMDVLSEAEWLPQTRGDAPRFGVLAAEMDLKPSDVARALGTTPGDAARLRRGEREITPEELRLILPLLGGATPSFEVSYDPNLVAALDMPEFRAALESHASRMFGGDDVAARRSVAEKQMALAARHREPGERNWRVLIREALRED